MQTYAQKQRTKTMLTYKHKQRTKTMLTYMLTYTQKQKKNKKTSTLC